MTAVNWMFVVVLFVMCLGLVGLGILLIALTWGSGLGLLWGILSILAGLGAGCGGGFLVKYNLSLPKQ